MSQLLLARYTRGSNMGFGAGNRQVPPSAPRMELETKITIMHRPRVGTLGQVPETKVQGPPWAAVVHLAPSFETLVWWLL